MTLAVLVMALTLVGAAVPADTGEYYQEDDGMLPSCDTNFATCPVGVTVANQPPHRRELPSHGDSGGEASVGAMCRLAVSPRMEQMPENCSVEVSIGCGSGGGGEAWCMSSLLVHVVSPRAPGRSPACAHDIT